MILISKIHSTNTSTHISQASQERVLKKAPHFLPVSPPSACDIDAMTMVIVGMW